MAKTHPYILPGYAPMAIAPYDVEPTSSPVFTTVANDVPTEPVLVIPPEPGTALMVIEPEVVEAEVRELPRHEPSEGGLFASNDINECVADPFSSSTNIAADRGFLRRRMIPVAAMLAGIMLSIGGYAFSSPDLGDRVASTMVRDSALATPVKMTNGMPANMVPLLDVYYQPQPLETDRVVVEKDANGCEWKVAFDGSVNIPKGRYPSLNTQNVQKCTDSTRAARPEIVRVARGSEPKGKPGASIAIVNVIDPATGMTDRQAFASFKGNEGEVSVDKATIDSIIRSELARAKTSGPSAPRPQQYASRSPVPATPSRYPGIEYGNRAPTAAMPSMPGSAGAAGDDRPTYIPYIPGVPYTPPASLNRSPQPLRSIKPKVTGGIVKREMVPQLQSARPGGGPTELRAAPPPPEAAASSGPNGTPSGSPLG